MQEALFYGFSLERHVPDDHLLRKIDRFVDLSEVRTHLEPYYSETGRPSIDPELMIRMLIVGYCLGIRSERRLCEEVHLNLAYRWFCRLGLDGGRPRSFDLFQEPPRPFSRERSSAQAVRDRCGALHQGTDRGRRSFRG
jgi:transposase